MMAYGEVESVWPAVGAVLVCENVAYAHAGRSSESDGGIAVVALDPATGATVWGKAIAPGPQRMNDLLCLRDGALGWHHVRLDPKTGVAGPPAKPTETQGGILDGIWTLVGRRRSGNAYAIGKGADKKNPTWADLLAWNGSLVVAPGFAMAREKADATVGPAKQQDFSWRPAVPNGGQVEAVALCGSAALYAGRIREPKPNEPGGFLVIVSAADGKKAAEFPLEAPPTYDGLAVARDRVVVALQNGTLACFGR